MLTKPYGLGPSKRHLKETSPEEADASVRTIRPGLTEDSSGKWSYDPAKSSRPPDPTKI